jgi:hypothetical protein
MGCIWSLVFFLLRQLPKHVKCRTGKLRFAGHKENAIDRLWQADILRL